MRDRCRKNKKIKGNLIVKGDTYLKGTLKVKEEAKFEENIEIGGNAIIDQDLTVKGSETIDQNLTVKGDTTIQGKITVNDISTNEICLNPQVTPPVPMLGKGCYWVDANGVPHYQYPSGLDSTVNTTPANPFHGWWKAVSATTSMDGFGNLNLASYPFASPFPIADQYIFIDTQTYSPYATVTTTCGTLKFPRDPQLYVDLLRDTFTPDFLYYPVGDTAFVQINDLNGPAPSPFYIYSSWSINLVDNNTLATAPNSQAYYIGQSSTLGLYKRMNNPPVIMPSDQGMLATFPNYNNPVDMGRYIASMLETSVDQSQNVNLHTNHVSFQEQAVLLRQFFEGLPAPFTVTTPVWQIRVSVPYRSPKLTDIYTSGFSFVTSGATVTLAGFTGPLIGLNGTYVNGVSLEQVAGAIDANANFVDTGPGGTWNNIFNHFLLNFDSSSLSGLADPNTGFIAVPVGATVTVTHQFTPTMQYPAFIAAVWAMYYAIWKNSTHTSIVQYTTANRIFPAPSWTGITAGVTPTVISQGRTGQFDADYYYFGTGNSTSVASRFGDYNDPWNIRSLSPYNVPGANYIVDTHMLFYAIQGTLDPDQIDPTIFGYLPLIPAPGRAHFIGQLAPATNVGGTLTVLSPPDPTYWAPWGGSGGVYFVGKVNPAFTGGKTVGYTYFSNCEVDQVASLSVTGMYSPDSPLSPTPRSGRESLNSILSALFEYIVSINCNSLIMDIRSNTGGVVEVPLALSEFMGVKRKNLYYYQTYMDDGLSALIDPAVYPSVYNFIPDNLQCEAYSYADISLANYPSAMWIGTAASPKTLVILTDVFALSGGDAWSRNFLGENMDGQQGNYTSTVILGNIDGRLFGFQAAGEPIPAASDPIVPIPPNPVSNSETSVIHINCDAVAYVGLLGDTAYTTCEQFPGLAPSAAPSLTGGAGNNPLPMSGETTIYYDFGFVTPYPAPPLPGWTAGSPPGQPSPTDQTTWRDRILEQAIQYGTLHALTMSASNEISEYRPAAPVVPTIINPDDLPPLEVKTSSRMGKMRQLKHHYDQLLKDGKIVYDKMGRPIPIEQAKSLKDIQRPIILKRR